MLSISQLTQSASLLQKIRLIVRPSVCLSHAATQKRLNISSNFFHYMIATLCGQKMKPFLFLQYFCQTALQSDAVSAHQHTSLVSDGSGKLVWFSCSQR